jgi:hypothetical protein
VKKIGRDALDTYCGLLSSGSSRGFTDTAGNVGEFVLGSVGLLDLSPCQLVYLKSDILDNCGSVLPVSPILGDSKPTTVIVLLIGGGCLGSDSHSRIRHSDTNGCFD